ncbi:MAG TPA: hypothetical protein VLA12_23560, partial [Planctomycetaceae bacterium]|nr:hypothetical protein [Planctomycetaceae bacterium]
MKLLNLNDLPKVTPWALRLLSIEEFSQKNRDMNQIENEYNLDKYKRCLDLFNSSPENPTATELRIAIDRVNRDGCMDAVV